ncbi:hypothetical protein F5887DRAFT_1058744 [Amanita rubescens]|nr:hypothetical protein F5887DRAFT_1058744 [Amanita rubescens]
MPLLALRHLPFGRRVLSHYHNPRKCRPYTFHLGASWAAKPNDPYEKLVKIPFPSDSLIGSWRDKILAWPKRIQSKDPGEDFLYIQTGISFGVADGVGGWTVSGVDPALFSQALMYHAHRYSRNAWPGEPEIDPTLDYEEREQIEGWEMTPVECLDLAYGGVLRETFVQAGESNLVLDRRNNDRSHLASTGSSTALLINLNAHSGVLRTASQLTKLPADSGRKFAGACIDSPNDAEVYETTLRDGDIIVAYMVSICSLVSRAGGTEDEQVQAMADRMVDFARQCMRSKRVSPFERAAAREGIISVTIVVSLVRETT